MRGFGPGGPEDSTAQRYSERVTGLPAFRVDPFYGGLFLRFWCVEPSVPWTFGWELLVPAPESKTKIGLGHNRR